MRFGLVVTQFSGQWKHCVGDAYLAEEVGLDSIWLADHLLATMNVEGDIFEGWTAMAALAGSTERVRLGHLVLAASFRNPGLMAKMAATLDHASAGRLDLGLGAGWFESEYKAFGFRFPSPGQRRRYFEEYLDSTLSRANRSSFHTATASTSTSRDSISVNAGRSNLRPDHPASTNTSTPNPCSSAHRRHSDSWTSSDTPSVCSRVDTRQ